MSDIIQTYLSPEGLRRFIEEAKANVPEEKAKEYERGTTLGYAKNRLYSQIESNGNGRLTIKRDNGEEAYINKGSVDKMLSAAGSSTKNGVFTKEQHFAAVANVDNLYRNSTKALTHPDKKFARNITAIQRRVAPLFGDRIAYLTVKEIEKQGKKIHSIELIELGKLEGKMAESSSAPATNNPIHNIQNPPTLG